MSPDDERSAFSVFAGDAIARAQAAPPPACFRLLPPGSPAADAWRARLPHPFPAADTALVVQQRRPARIGVAILWAATSPLFLGVAALAAREASRNADTRLLLGGVAGAFALGAVGLVLAAIHRVRAEYYLVFTPTELQAHRGMRWGRPAWTLPRAAVRRVELHERVSTRKDRAVERRWALRVTRDDRTQRSLSLIADETLPKEEWAWLGGLAARWAGVELYDDAAGAVLLPAPVPDDGGRAAAPDPAAPPERITLLPPGSPEARALAESFTARPRTFAADRTAFGVSLPPRPAATGQWAWAALPAGVALAFALIPLAVLAMRLVRLFTVGWEELTEVAVCALVAFFCGIVALIAGAIFANRWAALTWRLELLVDADRLWVRRSLPGWRREDVFSRADITQVTHEETGTLAKNGNRIHTDWGLRLHRRDGKPLYLVPAEGDERVVLWLDRLLSRWLAAEPPESRPAEASAAATEP